MSRVVMPVDDSRKPLRAMRAISVAIKVLHLVDVQVTLLK